MIVPLLFLLYILILLSSTEADDVVVTTNLGKLRGKLQTYDNGNVSVYLGIHYAKAPVAELRFRKPVAIGAWSGILNATQYGPACSQSSRTSMSEDCLVLNIYVPETRHTKAVMVWIHGGGYVAGQGTTNGAPLALVGDVIVVGINYRLDVFGFISTGDSSSRGNYGLWDQLMALRFIKDNIASFGGDPQKITIFGESAGGYSVGLLILSPQSKGLFHRAICQSGVGISPRTLAFDAVRFTQDLSDRLNCTVLDSQGRLDTISFMKCLRNQPARKILDASVNVRKAKNLAWRLKMAPVVDGKLIPADPRHLITPSNQFYNPMVDIDLMAGVLNGDGVLILWPLTKFQKQLGFNVKDGIPARVFCENISTSIAVDYFPTEKGHVAQRLCQQYSSKRYSDSEQARQVVNMYGDMMFAAPTLRTLQAHARHSNKKTTYHYVFSHQRVNARPPWFRGAKHAEELEFVFGYTSARNTTLAKQMMRYWTNFAKFGNPNGEMGSTKVAWQPFDETQRAYLNLDDIITPGYNLWSQRMVFWLTLSRRKNSDPQLSTPTSRAVSSTCMHKPLPLWVAGFYFAKMGLFI
ncbi:neuroligin-4, Y-linked-like [Gigantopelta aegis]|uniref:neuroligin-4, Y-linked-like n=1 Tax=Gigantopelta aegis TaxID=1735272 RepID=UPI001B88C2CA|nr:neuroligin-4, Y-linked-like [Gigantopelta aegis]XP_041354346.1 neuroligin-4, Y-linked-like [Gigantopelta aegis]